jgi:hypothetical protein
MKRVLSGGSILLVAASLLLSASHSYAALGGDLSSVVRLQARLGAKLQTHQRPHFTIHELEVPTGAKVREFVGKAGRVFAVAWSGGFRPNLRDLMGEHYDRFIAGTRGRRVARGVARIELPGMVVIMGGRLRNSFGKVVLTESLPAGVGQEDLR